MALASPAHQENRIVLAGTVVAIKAVRVSPAGIPICSFILAHESQQREADLPRRVKCKINVVASGAKLKGSVETLHVGQAIQVAGFIAYANYRDEGAKMVIHAETLTPCEEYSSDSN